MSDIERLRKLEALAENPGTPEEGEVARNKAAALRKTMVGGYVSEIQKLRLNLEAELDTMGDTTSFLRSVTKTLKDMGY